MVQKFVLQSNSSIPAKRVLSHNRRRNLLRANTAALAAATSTAAATTRSYTAIASTMHPSRCTAGNGSVCHATSGAGYRTGALMCDAFVPVSTSNEEHGGTIGNRTHDSAGSDASS